MIFFHRQTVSHTLKSMKRLYELTMSGGKNLAYALRMMVPKILLVALVHVIVLDLWSLIDSLI